MDIVTDFRKHSIPLIVIEVSDGFGKEWVGVCNDWESVIYVYGLTSESGLYLTFESEARHLRDWADYNGLTLYTEERLLTLDKC
jgi:hypothetical protein